MRNATRFPGFPPSSRSHHQKTVAALRHQQPTVHFQGEGRLLVSLTEKLRGTSSTISRRDAFYHWTIEYQGQGKDERFGVVDRVNKPQLWRNRILVATSNPGQKVRETIVNICASVLGRWWKGHRDGDGR